MKAPVAAALDSWEDYSVDPATEDSEEAILASPETSCSDVVVVDSAEIEVLSKAAATGAFIIGPLEALA